MKEPELMGWRLAVLITYTVMILPFIQVFCLLLIGFVAVIPVWVMGDLFGIYPIEGVTYISSVIFLVGGLMGFYFVHTKWKVVLMTVLVMFGGQVLIYVLLYDVYYLSFKLVSWFLIAGLPAIPLAILVIIKSVQIKRREAALLEKPPKKAESSIII